ncbi:hypothetical protein NSMM_90026 [Nitrosomonas mobilis]|uniref:Uncharacterized protein n=1 Tax=Nitrosomonas mobilis TaxID=51642 RepID=A0A1G5SL08_9PROT|nr:hypothetical protein NSMM_90026 [Nitrosomonas mobilis]
MTYILICVLQGGLAPFRKFTSEFIGTGLLFWLFIPCWTNLLQI